MSDVRSDTRILVVEDEAIVARDLAQRLEDLGYEVTGTAATGAEALSLAQSTRPSLVFMDITIQGPIDGVETAHRLVSQMDVPIIFLTAHTDSGTIQRARTRMRTESPWRARWRSCKSPMTTLRSWSRSRAPSGRRYRLRSEAQEPIGS